MAMPTLAGFVDAYIAKRMAAKKADGTPEYAPSTFLWYNQTRRRLVDYYGATRPLDRINAAETKDWRQWLATDQKLGENTIAKTCSFAKQFFGDAVDREILAKNPFEKMKNLTVNENRDRDYFVTRDVAAAIIDACPDAEWRLIFALSRFGGLRCPSEHLRLKWEDVHFGDGSEADPGKITVHSSKTRRHTDKGVRVLPLFPELREHFEDVYTLAKAKSPDGVVSPSAWVITRYRQKNANLRTQLERVIRKAGIEPWPKLFQNLRSTRETELNETYPMHVVCSWIGNSPKVAAKHYLQTTPEHFQKAAAAPETCSARADFAAKPCNAVQDNSNPSTQVTPLHRVASNCAALHLNNTPLEYTRQDSNL